MSIKTVINKLNMNNQIDIQQPIQLAEIMMSTTFEKTPHLMNSLDKKVNNPSIRKSGKIPFN